MHDIWLANLILVIHALFVGFVVFGLLATVAGGVLGWRWVRNRWYRCVHLLAISIVVAEAWLGIVCPLTEWEAWLRPAHDGYPHGFVAYWLQRMIYFDAPQWVFTLSYTLFFLVVLATFVFVPVRWRRQRGPGSNRA